MAVCHNLARVNNEKARANQDVTDNVPRSQPAVPLRRPHGNTPNHKRENQDRADTENNDWTGSNTSKGSVKSMGSNGAAERSNNFQEKPKPSMSSFKSRVFNQEREQSVKATAIEPPKNEEPNNRLRTVANRVPHQVSPAQKPDEAKIEPAKPAAAPVPRPNFAPKTVKPEAVKPQEAAPAPKEIIAPVVRPASVSDTTPTRKLVPKNYLLQKLNVGDSIVMSVDMKASECRASRGDYICLTMAEAFEADYCSLCEDYTLDCNQDEQPAKLTPGETISYFNPDDCGWYRARCLNPTTLALLDSGKIVTVTSADKCRKLPSKYEAAPEFCAVLASKAVELGASLNCKILSQTADGYKVSMSNVETGDHIGEGEVFRWLPTVEYQPVSTAIPDVSRPPLVDGTRVLLVLANNLDEVFVRPADKESQWKYNDVVQQVLLGALKGKPLSEPPHVGQTVISKFTDGIHYRALVRRINVSKNKYQIEYAENGNIQVSTLENLFPCPADCDLSNVTTEVSKLKLAPPTELSAAALQFLQELQDEELLLTLPDGRKTVPSGGEATLTIVKNKVNLGERLLDMCKPEWKKVEERGGTIGEINHLTIQDIEYTVLPEAGCTIEVLDASMLTGGIVCGHDRADPNAELIFNKLTAKIADYCNSELARAPYTPAIEELCFAQLPPYPQWFRAVYLNMVASKSGSAEGKIFYLDYGNFADVPMTLLRKMMPEFVTGLPVMGLYLEIKDFPKDPSDDMIARAVAHMNIDEEGRGTLKVSKCERHTDIGTYIVEAPELIAAMRG